MSDDPPVLLIFAYGTLRTTDTQLDTFGRVPASEPDLLPGFTVDYIDIQDPRDAMPRERRRNPVLRATGNASDKVAGVVLLVREDELDAADEYEVEVFHRERVRLASGREAWVFIRH